jgi:uncharacterized protein (TIGR02453 family)
VHFPPFPGFRDEAFDFLRDLAANNDRDWFKPRKQVYDDEVKWPLQCLLADVSQRAAEEGIPLRADPKKSLFRIYRDVRFSKDKSPYKPHGSAVFTRSGSKKESGGVYVHIKPGECFFGGGFWKPEKQLLAAWRERIANEPATFLGVVDELTAKGLELEAPDYLKRMPRGYTDYAESPAADYLRYKGFFATRFVSDASTQTPAFAEEIIRLMRAVMPLLEYGWETKPGAERADP